MRSNNELSLLLEKISQKNLITEDSFIEVLPPNFAYYQFKNKNLNPNFKMGSLGILSLRLMVNNNFGSEVVDLDDDAVLIIKFENKTHQRFRLSQEDCLKLKQFFKENNTPRQDIYTKKGTRFNIACWLKKTTSDYYSEQPRNPLGYYDLLHQKIIQHIVEKDGLIYDDLVVVDGGCGDTGNLLKNLEVQLKIQSISNFHLVGFDFNSKNIKKCYDNYSGKIQFLNGNVVKIQTVLNQSTYLNPKSSIILILSGSLTRMVLKDGFEAVEALKNIALDGRIDYLIGGGAQAPLITNYIAKQMGYQRIDSHTELDHFFIFKKMTHSEIIQYRREKFDKYQILDLSLSPDPLTLFKELSHAITQYKQREFIIDLSFNALTDEFVSAIKTFSQDFPKAQLCYWHNDPNDITKFISVFADEMWVSSLKLIEDEGYLMSSRLFFSKLHTKGFFSEKIKPDRPSDKLISLINAADAALVNEILFEYVCKISTFMRDFKENMDAVHKAYGRVKILWIKYKSWSSEEQEDEKDLVQLAYEDRNIPLFNYPGQPYHFSEPNVIYTNPIVFYPANPYPLPYGYRPLQYLVSYQKSFPNQPYPYNPNPLPYGYRPTIFDDFYSSYALQNEPAFMNETDQISQNSDETCEFADQLKDELSFKIKAEDDEMLPLLEDYLDELTHKLFHEKQSQYLLLLMKILNTRGTNIVFGTEQYFDFPPINLKREITIYGQLATIMPYAEYFNKELMYLVAKIRLNNNPSSLDFDEAALEMQHYFEQNNLYLRHA